MCGAAFLHTCGFPPVQQGAMSKRAAQASRAVDDASWDLHQAAYLGRLDVVTRLLAEGADPNAHHDPSETGWVCGPTPLNKAIAAWAVTEAHVAIVALLLDRGARVDETHFSDHRADSMGGLNDSRILDLLERARRGRAVRDEK
jgi:ankyrin repeat protein